MITLLSPAKKLNFDEMATTLEVTRPRLQDDTREIAKVAKKQSAGQLGKLMKISDNLAELNAERFKAFDLEGRSNSSKPAGLTFDGDVYWGLEAKSMDDAALAYAQDHLRILSGLYGLLRPMDAIQPYRLEMGTKMANPRGKSLYDFWGSRIGEKLAEDLNDHGDNTVVNLASNEYFKAVDTSVLPGKVIEASFLNVKDGEARRLMYHVKYARGLMARWIIENRIEKADDLRGFDAEGYRFDASASSETELIFTRKQPPVKKK
ncbi:peroxide stress protein YaaA [Erythrobacter sp. F6033]|uniref:peroxide stress protein YaaA n=1 Tax=Erythrobacter sp. F6033 TaxID=2926401 RepID=UPI001FF165BC|nr:peroxide stress protein YaaA [Erythrobacter sp. F6033]MCK0127253.1 peroxide stress protein YaaA [Erythrobacter sp. F6033]